MPIQISSYTDSDTGVPITTSYWFVMFESIDRITNQVKFMMGGYNSLASKNAGKIPFRFKELTTNLTTLNITGAMSINQLINAMEVFALTDPFFAGGIQV